MHTDLPSRGNVMVIYICVRCSYDTDYHNATSKPKRSCHLDIVPGVKKHHLKQIAGHPLEYSQLSIQCRC